jgi:tRNA(fMet)-specific endonuclease VapC
MNYLLDTNIALIYLRNNQASRKLANALNFFSIDTNLLISVVSIGELKSIAKQNRWGEKRVNALLEWLDTFVVLDINIEEIVERYAEIDAFSQGKLEGKTNSFSARNMGNPEYSGG